MCAVCVCSVCVCVTEEIGRGSGCSAVSSSIHLLLLLPLPTTTLFCSISFITVSWLRNRAIVRVLDREGQQKLGCGFVLRCVTDALAKSHHPRPCQSESDGRAPTRTYYLLEFCCFVFLPNLQQMNDNDLFFPFFLGLWQNLVHMHPYATSLPPISLTASQLATTC